MPAATPPDMMVIDPLEHSRNVNPKLNALFCKLPWSGFIFATANGKITKTVPSFRNSIHILLIIYKDTKNHLFYFQIFTYIDLVARFSLAFLAR